MVVLFSGHSSVTDVELRKIKPVLVNPAIVRTLITFLIDRNPAYSSSEGGFNSATVFSQANMDSLGSGLLPGVPASVTVGRFDGTYNTDGFRHGYAEDADLADHPDVMVDSVGWTDSDITNTGYDQMKLSALTWCLQGRSFLHSRVGNVPIRDFDAYFLLTWMWPKLDPFGLSGFGMDASMNPVDMGRQVTHLISLYDSAFARDPTFAFVCYNIIQKKNVVNSLRFRIRMSEKDRLVRDLSRISKSDVEAFERRSRLDPLCKPRNDAERDIMRILQRLNLCVNDLPGTAGNKTKCRNEIRGM
ncbi:hypothetical protein CALCODRAFT_427221, partial [Calocera cornea HHB12733]